MTDQTLTKQETLDQLFTWLIEANRNLEAAQKRFEDFLEEIPQYKELKDNIKEQKVAVDNFEKQIGEVALQIFNETEERKPHDLATIKQYTSFEYDEDSVLEWAKENMPLFVLTVLDKKGFEAYVKGTDSPPNFVKEVVTPKVTFSRKGIRERVRETQVEREEDGAPF